MMYLGHPAVFTAIDTRTCTVIVCIRPPQHQKQRKVQDGNILEDFGGFCLYIALEQCFSFSLESTHPFRIPVRI